MAKMIRDRAVKVWGAVFDGRFRVRHELGAVEQFVVWGSAGKYVVNPKAITYNPDPRELRPEILSGLSNHWNSLVGLVFSGRFQNDKNAVIPRAILWHIAIFRAVFAFIEWAAGAGFRLL